MKFIQNSWAALENYFFCQFSAKANGSPPSLQWQNAPSQENTNSQAEIKAIHTERDTFHKIITSKPAGETTYVCSPHSLCSSAIYRSRVAEENSFSKQLRSCVLQKRQFYQIWGCAGIFLRNTVLIQTDILWIHLGMSCDPGLTEWHHLFMSLSYDREILYFDLEILSVLLW